MALFTGGRNYRLVFSANAISNLGDGVSVLAYPWLATMISNNPIDIALVAFASRLPWFLFALPAGVITDLFEHRRLMVWADTFRFIVTLGVVFMIFFIPNLLVGNGQRESILLLSFAVFLLGMAEVLRDNTAQTILPSIVDIKDLPHANGQLLSIERIMVQFVGPLLAGFLIAISLPLPFLLDAATFAISAILVLRLLVQDKVIPTQRQPAINAMKEGFIWLFHRPILFSMAVMTGLMNLGSIISLTILILFAQEILNLGAAEYGLLLAGGAAGGVFGGLMAPWIVTRIGSGWGLRIAIILITLESTIIAFAIHPIMVGVALFTGVFGGMMWNVIALPLRQQLVPPELLGRVNSVYRFFAWGVMPVGALLGGIMVANIEEYIGREFALRATYLSVSIWFLILTTVAFQYFSNDKIAASKRL